ncbi:MAG: chorismate mutase [Firmicutes bacterium]|nr:chorismate mutase [Bacillota bacterium]
MAEKKNEKLEALRGELNKTDSILEQAFLERMETVRKIGALKAAEGLPTYYPAREEKVLAMHSEKAPEELKGYMREFFQKLMDLSKEYQKQHR